VTLREDAIAIWKAAVDAVDSTRLVEQNVSCDSQYLQVAGQNFPLAGVRRIVVVGAGKAGAGMSQGLLKALQSRPPSITVTGWVNVPEDCVRDLPDIQLHAARPAGVNEPTAAGVSGTQAILNILSAMDKDTLGVVIISGGGSALLPAPISGITLADKLSVTRLLALAGAPIQHLNLVRSQLSQVKGGRLLRHVNAGRLVTLIVSDVIGDPLEFIASGPTVPSSQTPADALKILQTYDPDRSKVPASVFAVLERSETENCAISADNHNFLIGSNAVALEAAAAEATRRGYSVKNLGDGNKGEAQAHGRDLLLRLSELRDSASNEASRPYCVLAGGETTVRLSTTESPGLGGRNQEVVLGAIAARPDPKFWNNIALLSGGTDGEDGPTDAAGALADQQLVEQMGKSELHPDTFLKRHNAYPFFQQLDGLLLTGPTHTNVMDVAVGLVGGGDDQDR